MNAYRDLRGYDAVAIPMERHYASVIVDYISSVLDTIYFSKKKRQEEKRIKQQKHQQAQQTKAERIKPKGHSKYAKKASSGNREFWDNNQYNNPNDPIYKKEAEAKKLAQEREAIMLNYLNSGRLD